MTFFLKRVVQFIHFAKSERKLQLMTLTFNRAENSLSLFLLSILIFTHVPRRTFNTRTVSDFLKYQYHRRSETALGLEPLGVQSALFPVCNIKCTLKCMLLYINFKQNSTRNSFLKSRSDLSYQNIGSFVFNDVYLKRTFIMRIIKI